MDLASIQTPERPRRARSRLVLRCLGAVLVALLFAVACGDDSETTPAGAGEVGPSGGKATILAWSESATLDAVSAIGQSGTDGLRMFAVYGALVVYDPARFEAVPVLAESFEPNDDFTAWTLTLREGLVFSDGTVLDADAVTVNWERVATPENRSPGFAAARTIEQMVVMDDRTLSIRLDAPNSSFPKMVARTALNYIASPTAIAGGHDLTSEPIGAGPFILESWTRDDAMHLVRNPRWYDAPRPYLDELTIRVVPDPQQRADTFRTGGADGFYSTIMTDINTVVDAGDAYFAGVQIVGTPAIAFNVRTPPLDDVRVRRALVHAIDRDAVAAMLRNADQGAHNLTLDGTPWFTAKGSLPEYDLAEAQRLIDEVRDGRTIRLSLIGSQSPQNLQTNRFLQASWNQLEGLEIEFETHDSPTFIGRTYQGDFQIASWGFPWHDPDPNLYLNIHSESALNFMGYSSRAVDDALDAARGTADTEERARLYEAMFEVLANDLPLLPFTNPIQGYVLSSDLRGGEVWEDGTLRPDLLWFED